MPNIGTQAEATRVVQPKDTAKHLFDHAGEAFPEVLATATMIALMELAAARVLLPLLEPGQLSVGVGVNVKHLAATQVGVEVRAVATYLGAEGKLHRFKVELVDDGGVAGEGEHTRAIIDEARLLAGAAARGKGGR
ncbi:thioesterase family protein [Enhygromyxa salina]|nr:hotdog domain-containing protein [Enhygromyxa salina]